MSDARNLGETAIVPGRVQPSAEIVRVGCAVALHFWRKSRTKRSFWRVGASLLEEVSYETLVLETSWRFTFGGSLVRNVRFGDLALHFWRKSRTKRSFWRLGAYFWRKSRTKRSFWRLGASLLEEVSYEALVLVHFWRKSRMKRSVWRLGASLFWRKSRTKRWFWRLGASLLEEVSYETLVLETWRFNFGGSLVRNAGFRDLALHFWTGSLVRNARFGDLALHFWRTSHTKHSFWRLGASLLEEVSYETFVLETWRFTFGGSLVRNAR